MFSQACIKNSVHVPLWADAPRVDTPLRALWDTVNRRAVRILLACSIVVEVDICALV